jgi:hypothetical protein
LNPEASGINHVGFFSPMAKAGFENETGHTAERSGRKRPGGFVLNNNPRGYAGESQDSPANLSPLTMRGGMNPRK